MQKKMTKKSKRSCLPNQYNTKNFNEIKKGILSHKTFKGSTNAGTTVSKYIITFF